MKNKPIVRFGVPLLQSPPQAPLILFRTPFVRLGLPLKIIQHQHLYYA